MKMAAAKSHEKTADNLPSSYWQETKRPLVCLAFVTPMLLIYEGGVLCIGAQAMRNGVDVYLRYLLELLGFGQYFLLPVLTAGILLAWHHTSAQPWRLRTSTLLGMWAESLILGILLLLFAQLQGAVFASTTLAVPCDTASAPTGHGAVRIIGYFGAGIYEELLFRLMLFPTVAGLIGYCGASRKTSIISAVIVTSLMFSAAHYRIFTLNTEAELFEWFSFVFRFLAGVFFSVLFVYRGFGVTAGSHALYDIFVQLLR